MEDCNIPDFCQMAQKVSEDSEENKKPIKLSRKQRVSQYVKRISDDNMEQVLEDILKENKRLRRELETARIQNTSLRREYEELTHAILRDRLGNYTDNTFI